MKSLRHMWDYLGGGDYRCHACGLDRRKWPILGLYRGWPFDRCTG